MGELAGILLIVVVTIVLEDLILELFTILPALDVFLVGQSL